MDWNAIISALISALLASGGLGVILFYKDNKRAKQLANENTASAQWRELYEKSELKCDAQSTKIDELYTKIGHLRDQNNGLTTQNAVLKILKCKRLGCSDRQPPLDRKEECNFKTEDGETAKEVRPADDTGEELPATDEEDH